MKKKKLGIIDADLLDNGTRHPNLACMKISAYYKKNGWEVKLLDSYDNLNKYDLVTISRVFNFTKIPTCIYKDNKSHEGDPHPELYLKKNIKIGGTGFYYEKAPDLDREIEHIMPDYHLYDEYIKMKIIKGVNEYEKYLNQLILKELDLPYDKNKEELLKIKEEKLLKKYCDYLEFSIGFTTRGCFRKCEFCVNKKYDRVHKHSPVSEFLDVNRPKIYLWDDNFMASPHFNEILDELIATNKPFQFRQGLDMRLMTHAKAEKLASVKYYGDYIFAFDHIEDRELISSKLKIWREHTNKSTKLYVLTGYDSQDEIDIENTFERIKILMEHGCLPYIMRYEDYKKSKFKTLYIQIARWCNQPGFFKKKSFRQYCEANEVYHRKNSSKVDKNCSCYQAMLDFETEYPEIAKKYFDLRFDQLNVYKKVK